MAENLPIAYYNTLNGLHRIATVIILSPNDPCDFHQQSEYLNKHLNGVKSPTIIFIKVMADNYQSATSVSNSIKYSHRLWNAVCYTTAYLFLKIDTHLNNSLFGAIIVALLVLVANLLIFSMYKAVKYYYYYF